MPATRGCGTLSNRSSAFGGDTDEGGDAEQQHSGLEPDPEVDMHATEVAEVDPYDAFISFKGLRDFVCSMCVESALLWPLLEWELQQVSMRDTPARHLLAQRKYRYVQAACGSVSTL